MIEKRRHERHQSLNKDEINMERCTCIWMYVCTDMYVLIYVYIIVMQMYACMYVRVSERTSVLNEDSTSFIVVG